MTDWAPTVAETPIALLCGLCPTRRVLTHLTLWSSPDRAEAGLPPAWVVGLVEPLRGRKQRPSVETRRLLAAPGQPRQWRCRRRHPWSFTEQQLRDAILAAVDAGRDEIIAGVDLR
jgi:hypothetical protein